MLIALSMYNNYRISRFLALLTYYLHAINREKCKISTREKNIAHKKMQIVLFAYILHVKKNHEM